MLVYKNQTSTINPCTSEVNVIKKGIPLDGKHVFRNELAQKLFDEMRNNSDLDRYGITDDGKHIFFQYLNGVVNYYTRRQFIKMANDYEEYD